MQAERSLPEQWPQLVAQRLSVSGAMLDRLMQRDERFLEICMDYAECATAVSNARSESPADLRHVQEYLALEREIALELEELLKQIS